MSIKLTAKKYANRFSNSFQALTIEYCGVIVMRLHSIQFLYVSMLSGNFPRIRLNTKPSACCSIASDSLNFCYALCAPWSPHWELHANASYEASVLLQYTVTRFSSWNMQMKIQLAVSF
jgi:hypothetical protein